MKHHDLKIWPVPFAEVRAGRKTFEIRDNDRDYQSGDTVTLREWDPLTHTYTGKREGPFTVGTVIPAGEWGFPENLCVFSLLRPSLVVMPEGVEELIDTLIEAAKSFMAAAISMPEYVEQERMRVDRAREALAAYIRSLSSPAPVEGGPDWTCSDCGHSGSDFRTITYSSTDGTDYDLECPSCGSLEVEESIDQAIHRMAGKLEDALSRAGEGGKRMQEKTQREGGEIA